MQAIDRSRLKQHHTREWAHINSNSSTGLVPQRTLFTNTDRASGIEQDVDWLIARLGSPGSVRVRDGPESSQRIGGLKAPDGRGNKSTWTIGVECGISEPPLRHGTRMILPSGVGPPRPTHTPWMWDLLRTRAELQRLWTEPFKQLCRLFGAADRSWMFRFQDTIQE